jgi:hypothetical protein
MLAANARQRAKLLAKARPPLRRESTFDLREYNREYQRKRRAKIKEAKQCQSSEPTNAATASIASK